MSCPAGGDHNPMPYFRDGQPVLICTKCGAVLT